MKECFTHQENEPGTEDSTQQSTPFTSEEGNNAATLQSQTVGQAEAGPEPTIPGWWGDLGTI